MRFPLEVARQLIIYDENGNPVIVIGPDNITIGPDSGGQVILDPTGWDDPQFPAIFFALTGYARYVATQAGHIQASPTFTGTNSERTNIQIMPPGMFLNDGVTPARRARITLASASKNLAGDFLNGSIRFDSYDSISDTADLPVRVLINEQLVTREVGVNVETTSTGDIGTTETVTDSVTAPLVIDRTYEIRWDGQIGPGTTDPAVGDRAILRLREDSAAGTGMDLYRHFWEGAPSLVQRKNSLRGRYTATATGNKTFVVTLDLETGAAGVDLVRFGASDRPSILTVTEVSD